MENVHMPYDLKQMQSLPLRSKILMTKQRIRHSMSFALMVVSIHIKLSKEMKAANGKSLILLGNMMMARL